MADKKYVRIPAKDLPDVFYVEADQRNAYFVRYKVMSEDGSISSRWSQKFEIPTNVSSSEIALTTSEWKAGINSGTLSITWNVDRLFADKKIFVNRFHVYVRFHDNNTTDPWVFMQETTATNFSTIMPTGKNKADVAILIPTYRGLDAQTTSTISPVTLYPESVLFLDTDV